jgi:hypothetical protein
VTPCTGYIGHPFKKGLFDNDDSAFQAPFVRTDVLSSQYREHDDLIWLLFWRRAWTREPFSQEWVLLQPLRAAIQC